MGQAAPAASRVGLWSLQGLQGGACIEFLVSPSLAAEELRGNGVPVPVESLPEAHPALTRVARDEPQYRGWVPAQYCFFLYASGVANGKSFTVDRGRQPVAVGFVSFAASDLPRGATDFAVELFTNSAQLEGVADDIRLRVESVRFSRSPIPEQEDLPDRHRYQVRDGNTLVQWDGGPGGATSPVPRTLSLAGMAISSGIHFARATFTPDSAFTPSGNLQVVGQGELYTLLTASPIRLMTTFVRGGDTVWELTP